MVMQGTDMKIAETPEDLNEFQVEDAEPGIVEQGGHTRRPRLGAHQRLPDADELPDMGEQCPDHCDLQSSPAIRGHRIAEGPGDVGTVRHLQAHVQAVLVFTPEHYLVVGR